MLDPQLFDEEFVNWIAPHFGIDTSSERATFAWYKAVQHMSADRFRQVMEDAFLNCTRKDFGPPWVRNRANEIATREELSQTPTLALTSDLDRLTEEQRIENRRRIAELSRQIGRGAKNGSGPVDRPLTPLELAMAEPVPYPTQEA